LLHKLSTLSQPRLGPPTSRRPVEADSASLRVSQTTLHLKGLAYVAEGPAGADVRWQAPEGAPQTLWPVPEACQVRSVHSAGRHLLIGTVVSGQAEVVITHPTIDSVSLPGDAVTVSGDAQSALIADLVRKVWVRVDLSSNNGVQAADVGSLRFAAHEQLAPTVTLDATGGCALVMEVELGRVDLMHLDLQSGLRSPVLEGLPEPSWAQGVFAPGGGLVVQEMVHDLSRRFRLLRFSPGKPAAPLFTSPCAQPNVAPVFLDKAWMVLPLVLQADTLTGTGPVDLVAIPMAGGAQVKLTHTGDMVGRVGVAGRDVWVQTGPELRVLSGARPKPRDLAPTA
jgi:hypothetical protein